jgi:hypothetical protein
MQSPEFHGPEDYMYNELQESDSTCGVGKLNNARFRLDLAARSARTCSKKARDRTGSRTM